MVVAGRKICRQYDERERDPDQVAHLGEPNQPRASPPLTWLACRRTS